MESGSGVADSAEFGHEAQGAIVHMVAGRAHTSTSSEGATIGKSTSFW
jgi:hypothetical protein